MKRNVLFVLLLALVLLLASCGLPPVPGPTEDPALSATQPPTDPPAEPPTDLPTEPQPEVFTLSFAGDCTLGSREASWSNPHSFVGTVGDDYGYPFANVAEFFRNDDFTMVNLEGPLCGGGTPAEKEFVFRGKPEYTAILTGVEAVTLANNHARDYGEQGMKETKAALDAAGIAYGGREQRFVYTTQSGLTVGVYCDDFAFDRTQIREAIAALREAGAEVVVCAYHWGIEREYKPAQNEIDWAHISIDAGADIVYGTHPHVLQPIEYYGGGVIYYSLGNFAFGGNNNPNDKDTAVIQQRVVRDPDGTVRLGETVIIPCSISSVQGYNNYQPTPLEAGTAAYDRVMEKLAGTYQ